MDFSIGDNQADYTKPLMSTVDNGENIVLTNLDNMQTYPAMYDVQHEGLLNDCTSSDSVGFHNYLGEDGHSWASQVCPQQNMDYFYVNNDFPVTGDDLTYCSQHDYPYSSSMHDSNPEFQKMLSANDLEEFGSNDEYDDATSPYSEGSELSSDCELLQAINMPHDLTELDNYVHLGTPSESLLTDHQPMNIDSVYHENQYTPLCTIKSEEPLSFDESSCDTDSSLEPSASNCSALEKIHTSSRKRVRGPKNWEFVIRLLNDNNFNPEVIRWEDKAASTFRFVNPAKVAQMWGQRSNKPNLTYDNFARGLRYHYKTGALNSVSDRQLVYRCGPKALEFLRKLSQKSS